MRPLCKFLLLIPICGGLALGGCNKPQDAAAKTNAAEDVPIVLTTPREAARTALLALRAQLRAAARRDAAAVQRYRELLRTQVVAVEEIGKRTEKFGDRLPRLDEQLERKASERSFSLQEKIAAGFIENWAAVLNYYAEGLQLEPGQMEGPPPAEGEKRALVRVPARDPRGQTRKLQVECVRKDALWQVAGITFAADNEPGAARPVPGSQPASAPTP